MHDLSDYKADFVGRLYTSSRRDLSFVRYRDPKLNMRILKTWPNTGQVELTECVQSLRLGTIND